MNRVAVLAGVLTLCCTSGCGDDETTDTGATGATCTLERTEAEFTAECERGTERGASDGAEDGAACKQTDVVVHWDSFECENDAPRTEVYADCYCAAYDGSFSASLPTDCTLQPVCTTERNVTE